ncbi:single-stranded DNA-binding protein [Nocardiopsis suaedae]|uniref:Single-stranded DNA-binding protein n=1 Tax=Nocardiopsis suaedae TaxID=3018444 RepID=A0ABT4TIG2_9ACTN|nr:single-stranded DNA-binding protein [Nocardiopsis suaedae]MDA2804461.1 single-stranded DNA-binding protein [Nocardiopsis suaedae]
MANETALTLTGNLTRDPEVRWLEGGTPVASFHVASTPRYFAREASEWRDGEPLFLRCSAWRALAEHVAESLGKGDRVIVTGRLKQRAFTGEDGENRTLFELEVDDIGPSLRWATTAVTKTRGTAAPAAGQSAPGDRPPF